MDQIKKLDDVHDTDFNAIAVKRRLRTLTLKINEIIETVNALTAEYDEEHSDEDDVEDVSKLKLK